MRIKSALKSWVGCLICFGMLGAVPVYSQTAASPVLWQDSKLSVQFDNATISQVLNAISRATGIKLSVDPSVANVQQSISFRDLSLREGVLKVLEGSGIDFIVVGTPQSPQSVSQVLLLGLSPKGPVIPSVASVPAAPAGQFQRPNPFASATPQNPFSGQAAPEQAGPPQADSGGFLPFPEASDNPNGTNPQAPPAQNPVPPNPFNPNPSANPPAQPPSPTAPVPDRRAPGTPPVRR
ncbi:MAG: hypothetical protein LAO21_18840 [Acidobacteriia bacterium]|nr:hypothetical protein [Terriglobia bacterium]